MQAPRQQAGLKEVTEAAGRSTWTHRHNFRSRAYLLLRGNGEFVAGDEAAHLLQRETQELLSLHHLSEMLLWKKKETQITDKHFEIMIEIFASFSHQLPQCLHTHTHKLLTVTHNLWRERGGSYRRRRGLG